MGWAAFLAPVVMGNPDRPELATDLEATFCSIDPVMARQFAEVTFLGDNRADLARVTTPSLIDPVHATTPSHRWRSARTFTSTFAGSTPPHDRGDRPLPARQPPGGDDPAIREYLAARRAQSAGLSLDAAVSLGAASTRSRAASLLPLRRPADPRRRTGRWARSSGARRPSSSAQSFDELLSLAVADPVPDPRLPGAARRRPGRGGLPDAGVGRRATAVPVLLNAARRRGPPGHRVRRPGRPDPGALAVGGRLLRPRQALERERAASGKLADGARRDRRGSDGPVRRRAAQPRVPRRVRRRHQPRASDADHDDLRHEPRPAPSATAPWTPMR